MIIDQLSYSYIIIIITNNNKWPVARRPRAIVERYRHRCARLEQRVDNTIL